MSRKIANSRIPLQKHTTLLFKGDFARLGELYPDLGASVMLRHILRKHLEKFESVERSQLPMIEDLDV